MKGVMQGSMKKKKGKQWWKNNDNKRYLKNKNRQLVKGVSSLNAIQLTRKVFKGKLLSLFALSQPLGCLDEAERKSGHGTVFGLN